MEENPVANKLSTTELVDKVQRDDKKAKQLNHFALGLLALFIIGVLGFIAIQSTRSNEQLRTLINNHYSVTQQVNKNVAAELAAIANNHNQTITALQAQDAYLRCLGQALVQGTTGSGCPDPFSGSSATPQLENTAPSANVSAPKSTTTPVTLDAPSNSPANSQTGTASGSTATAGSTTSGSTTQQSKPGPIKKILTFLGL